jgi:hypothetical protein
MGVPVIRDKWDKGTPLWYYILKEAEEFEDGNRLGPVGGRIVAEVLIGLLRADPASYLNGDPQFTPPSGCWEAITQE